jgi:hypothetical protein
MSIISNPKTSLKCSQCKKKLNICNSITCKCNKLFCMEHRYYDKHDCPINYKEIERKIIEKNNPKVIAEKILTI